MNQEERDALEALIDRHGPKAVLAAFGTICFEKAKHIAENWQDTPAARRWAKVGMAVDKATAAAWHNGF